MHFGIGEGRSNNKGVWPFGRGMHGWSEGGSALSFVAHDLKRTQRRASTLALVVRHDIMAARPCVQQ